MYSRRVAPSRESPARSAHARRPAPRITRSRCPSHSAPPPGANAGERASLPPLSPGPWRLPPPSSPSGGSPAAAALQFVRRAARGLDTISRPGLGAKCDTLASRHVGTVRLLGARLWCLARHGLAVGPGGNATGVPRGSQTAVLHEGRAAVLSGRCGAVLHGRRAAFLRTGPARRLVLVATGSVPRGHYSQHEGPD